MQKILLFIISFFYFIPSCFASSIVMDMDSNRILYENNAYEKRLIASTTKIMTALLAIESNKLDQLVTIKDEVLAMYGSNIYIERNEEILLLDLVYGLILRSGNDAASSIAVFVGKTEENFVTMMNKKAKELGMKDTIFSNPHGLDDETKNYSTAYDLCLLYSYAFKLPMFKQIVGTKTYDTISSLKPFSWINRNDLLFSYNKATGGKTGYTPKAGRILVSSAAFNNINLCMVTFDKNSYMTSFHETKYEYIFNNYQNYNILDKNNILIKGINEKLYLKENFSYVLNEKEYKKLNIKTKINKKYHYKDKDIIGEIYVYLNDEIIEKQNIYVSIKKTNFFTKLRHFFEKTLPF